MDPTVLKDIQTQLQSHLDTVYQDIMTQLETKWATNESLQQSQVSSLPLLSECCYYSCLALHPLSCPCPNLPICPIAV